MDIERYPPTTTRANLDKTRYSSLLTHAVLDPHPHRYLAHCFINRLTAEGQVLFRPIPVEFLEFGRYSLTAQSSPVCSDTGRKLASTVRQSYNLKPWWYLPGSEFSCTTDCSACCRQPLSVIAYRIENIAWVSFYRWNQHELPMDLPCPVAQRHNAEHQAWPGKL